MDTGSPCTFTFKAKEEVNMVSKNFIRFGEYRRSLCRMLENQRERFACERIYSLSSKSVNHSEYFPMARHFRTDRLTTRREVAAKSHARHVVMVGLWQLRTAKFGGGIRAGRSQIVQGLQRGINTLLPWNSSIHFDSTSLP